MKINTDGVLLGAIAGADNPSTILDIGSGTGVIALMLAQRFTDAAIDAVEIDNEAAKTAETNFINSSFSARLTLFALGFEQYFDLFPEMKYDLIISNPPFYLASLKSPGAKKTLAKHTDAGFFDSLIARVLMHLNDHGQCWLILPIETAIVVKNIAARYDLHLQQSVMIHSFKTDMPHREILALGKMPTLLIKDDFVIYDEPKIYSARYQQKLKDFFTIF